MDWILGISTLLVNSGLGWTRGAWWMWGLHAINAAAWIFYAIQIEQYGLIPLSVVTIAVDVVSFVRNYRR